MKPNPKGWRSKLREMQRNRCAICQVYDPNHTDHDHTTGLVRGFLCSHCNHGLGNFRDNQASLLRAIYYLGLTPAQQAGLEVQYSMRGPESDDDVIRRILLLKIREREGLQRVLKRFA